MAHDDQKHWTAQDPRASLEAVGHLARQVVTVLNERQGRQQHAARPYISNILDRRVSSRAAFDAVEVLSELRGFRLTDDMIVDSYIPTAARNIGERWTRSEIGFADVTIASARLQSLLTEVAYCDDIGGAVSLNPPKMLVVMGANEQHTLGGFVAAAQLRRSGAMVDVICAEEWPDVMHRIVQGSYDAVLFSSSRRSALESIGKIVLQTRETVPHAPVFALGGIILAYCVTPERVTHVDLVTNDVKKVVALCAERSATHPLVATK